MLITDQFVYIHMPKTGGTFVTSVLKKLHETRGDRIVEQRSDEKRRSGLWGWLDRRPTVYLLTNLQADTGEWNQHGNCAQIPPEHRQKPVLTTLRNPYDRYVSQFEFKWWQRRKATDFPDPEALLAKYPNYPDLSFEEFVHVSNEFIYQPVTNRLGSQDALGRHTAQFIGYFFRDPAVIHEIDHAYLAQARYRQDVHPNLHFTFTQTLNQDLHAFLLQMGYDPDEIAFIIDHEKIFPREGGRSEDQKWWKYYTPEIKAWVRHRERLLFEMFPQFDI